MICNMKRFVAILISLCFCVIYIAQAREKKVIIGISASKPSSATETYVKSVRRAGGVPLIIPITSEEVELKAVLKVVDGIIMTGGEDIAPHLYGEEPIPELGKVYAERDEFDLKLIKMAVEKKLAVMGICRGVQVMNVAFGGTLYQDIPVQLPESRVKHYADYGSDKIHKIKIKKGSCLGEILGESVVVNSTHHQSVKDLAPGFVVTAVAEDGVVEAIEMENGRPIFGVQFHPEAFVAAGDDEFLGLFEYFVKEAGR